jgi:hypothetical protein
MPPPLPKLVGSIWAYSIELKVKCQLKAPHLGCGVDTLLLTISPFYLTFAPKRLTMGSNATSPWRGKPLTSQLN